MKEINIEKQKRISDILNQAKRNAKQDKCILCEKETSSFCNSHSIPTMILKKISDNGFLSTPNNLAKFDFIDYNKGLKSTGTFKVICRECDSKYFSDYENPYNIEQPFSNKIMAQIALKNNLMQLAKRHEEIELNSLSREKISNYESLKISKQLDLRDYLRMIKITKKIINNNLKSGYVLLYFKVLPYVAPIAVQTPLPLAKDLQGNIINNLSDQSKNIYIQELHICIFPLSEKTIIAVFRHKNDNYYKAFEKQFNKLSELEKLKYVNYIIFRDTENFFFSPKVQHELQHTKLANLFSKINGYDNFGIQTISQLIQPQKIIEIEDIPNFLSESYRLM